MFFSLSTNQPVKNLTISIKNDIRPPNFYPKEVS